MVPILVVVLMTKVTNHEVIGVLVFWVASITDALDGYLARRWKQVRRWESMHGWRRLRFVWQLRAGPKYL